ncbi:MAG: type II toxin-antitoxin system RelB/DinJ family antitoxin [Actinomycetaceae bacterium]|nr:type II toxin-antitoxin system RelB/DinJ family antitoxin [Actinomycetaceae bacterium]MDY5854016.1 type II toxin-antitoxin system RelB/DinJ family antitoxin [Arcanobacterium sp.]
MAKTANINFRIEPQVKQDAEAVFGSFGISVTDAINIFLHQSIMEQGFPFAIKRQLPNAETVAALNEYQAMKADPQSYKRYDSFSDLVNEVLDA